MKVLVTGASSLLGANTIAELIRENHTVRGMVRTRNKIPTRTPGLEEYVGNITNKNEMQAAAEGCDSIIHIAANTDQNSLQYEEYASVNVNATRYVLEAAGKHHIKRVILVSSANAFGYGPADDPGTEEKDFCYPFTRSCYARSKYEAQALALQYPKENMGDIIVANPTFMIGKYDAKPSSGKIILHGYKKRIVFVPPGGKNFIHVKDAASAICSALTKGKDRECYLLANENMSYKAFYTLLDKVTQHRSTIIVIPKAILLFIGIIGSGLVKLGIRNALHYNNMKILCVKNYYSNQKAVQELGLEQTPVKTAVSDAVTWFLEAGILKQGSAAHRRSGKPEGR